MRNEREAALADIASAIGNLTAVDRDHPLISGLVAAYRALKIEIEKT